jgi:Dolichyl-phosphate-mannose-protein mannosyltransferase
LSASGTSGGFVQHHLSGCVFAGIVESEKLLAGTVNDISRSFSNRMSPLTRALQNQGLQVAGLLLVVMVLAAPIYKNLGQYSNFYDGGVYLESARMVSSGFAPYREVFAAQPPLWLELIRGSFAIFGQDMMAGQLVTVSALVVTAVAIGFVVWSTSGWLAAVLALVTILLSPLAFFWSREITAELPSAAFAALAIALAARNASSGRRMWLAAAALAIACALQVKLFGLYVLPAALLIAAGRWQSTERLSERLWHIVADSMLAVAIVVAVVVALALAYDLRAVWNQAVAFHFASRVNSVLQRKWSLQLNWHLIVETLGQEPALACAVLLAACAALEPWIGWGALVWLAMTLAGLLVQQPLFAHHVVSLIPPIALAAGIGLGALWKLGKRLRAVYPGGGRRAVAAGAGLSIVCVMLFVTVCGDAVLGHEWRQQQLIFRHSPRADLAVASELTRLTQQADMILTDAQGIAFQTNRAVPPWLADTSKKRIITHYLTTAEVISEVERYHVKTVLLWTGRLDQLPGLVAWLEQTFPNQRKYGRNRTLYLRP